ncbi:MAG: hypothetical protein AAGI30_07160 [Planctomycetota bacterium]
MRSSRAAAALACMLCAASALSDSAAPDDIQPHRTTPQGLPEPHYVEFDCHGFEVCFDAELYERDPALSARVVHRLEDGLASLSDRLPRSAFNRLSVRTRIWVSDAHSGAETPESSLGMVFHPSEHWLEARGLDIRMAGGIQIRSQQNFLDWRMHSPEHLLHELAHAFHRLLDQNTQELISEAFVLAQSSSRYEHVRYLHWRPSLTRRAYAMENQHEYFAELSEAFFGINEFQPHTRAELRSFDPVGYVAIESAWLSGENSNK